MNKITIADFINELGHIDPKRTVVIELKSIAGARYEFFGEGWQMEEAVDDGEDIHIILRRVCEHEWEWSYDCFEDAVVRGRDELGIPVKCKICGATGIEVHRPEGICDVKEDK